MLSTNNSLRAELRQLARALDGDSQSIYTNIVDQALFHGDLRYRDYQMFVNEDGPFATRLRAWVTNVSTPTDRKLLLQLLARLTFIDKRQMLSLCRDAYRRIITRWLSEDGLSAAEQLDPEYDRRMRERFFSYPLCSITESFPHIDFRAVNSIQGTGRPTVLTDEPKTVATRLPAPSDNVRGLVILEDFVGTGSQAQRALSQVLRLAPKTWRVLFVPLLVLERGLAPLLTLSSKAPRLQVTPVSIIPDTTSISPSQGANDDQETIALRALIRRLHRRVCARLDSEDDPPTSPFGYADCGSTVITYHNAANNALALFHHRSPDWRPLFRRAHHRRQ